MAQQFTTSDQFIEKVVHISRVAKVVKGGRRFSFSVIAVVGNGSGKVGVGVGKANEVPEAIRKATEKARRAMISVPILDHTIPHGIMGEFGAAKVMMKPAAPGTGVIAGGPVRAVMEAAGIQNVLTKSLGTNNAHNVVKATIEGFTRLHSPDYYAMMRSKDVEETDKSTASA